MMTYLVIGLCIFLLLIVVFVSAKPISMGIDARRSLKESNNDEDTRDDSDSLDDNVINKSSISEEIIKLNDLKKKGLLTEQEYQKAKNKILN